jgi:hypothetical protein
MGAASVPLSRTAQNKKMNNGLWLSTMLAIAGAGFYAMSFAPRLGLHLASLYVSI